MTKTNGTQIWPESLRALSAAGPSKLGADGIAQLHAFAAATPQPKGIDVVAQYSIDEMGFIDTNVFRGRHVQWTEYDPEDGPDNDRNFDWADLAVIMARDRMTHMVLLRLSDATPASKKELKAAPHGSLATVLEAEHGRGPSLLYKSHDEWIDLDFGVEESYKSGALLRSFTTVGLVWVAPDPDEPSTENVEPAGNRAPANPPVVPRECSEDRNTATAAPTDLVAVTGQHAIITRTIITRTIITHQYVRDDLRCKCDSPLNLPGHSVNDAHANHVATEIQRAISA
jgi:hypothetical protein